MSIHQFRGKHGCCVICELEGISCPLLATQVQMSKLTLPKGGRLVSIWRNDHFWTRLFHLVTEGFTGC